MNQLEASLELCGRHDLSIILPSLPLSIQPALLPLRSHWYGTAHWERARVTNY